MRVDKIAKLLWPKFQFFSRILYRVLMIFSHKDKVLFLKKVFGADIEFDGKEINAQISCINSKCDSIKKGNLYYSFRVMEDYGHCWKCGYKSSSLEAFIKRKNPSLLSDYRNNFQCLSRLDRALVSCDDELREPDKIPEPVDYPPDFQFIFDLDPYQRYTYFSRHLSYLNKRGITEDDFWRYRIGVSFDKDYKNFVIIPSYDIEGKINYHISRSIIPNPIIRYKNPPQRKEDIVFNELFIDWSEPIVLTEGVFDAINCGENAIPLLGCSLSERSKVFNQILKNNVSKVLIALDSAEEKTGSVRVQKLLRSYDIQAEIISILPYKDVGEMPRSEFQIRKQQCKH